MNAPAVAVTIPRLARARCFLTAFAATLSLLATFGAASGLAAQSDAENFDFESVGASISTQEAGAHPDFTNSFDLAGDPSHIDTFGNRLASK